MSDTTIPEEMHVLAGEYVLGVLDIAEMRAVRRQAMINPALHVAIGYWERWLSPVATLVAPVPPPEALWSRIEQAVAPLAEELDETPVTGPRAVPTPAPAPRPPEAPLTPRLRAATAPPVRPRLVWPWQFATFASAAIAAGIAALLLVPSLPERLNFPRVGNLAEPRIAALTPVDGKATGGFLAEAQPDGTVLLTAFAPVPVPSGRDLELWIVPPGAKAPASLGVLPAAGRKMVLPKMPVAGTKLLITVEPTGGSPTGAPTGPLVYGGALSL